MKLTKEDGNAIVWGDHDGWEEVDGTVLREKEGRWMLGCEGVFKHLESGKYYKFYWAEGATEDQECDPYEFDEPNPIEVHQVEKTVKVWEAVEK